MQNYFDSKLIYLDGKLITEDGSCVMMDWEADWMKRSAEIICKNGGDILNIGFGMGIIDSFIQEHNPATHWIIEAHPDVYKKMLEDGWHKKPNVRIIFGKWQDVIHTLPMFDGIYLDTFHDSGKGDTFVPILKKILKPNGIFSYWEGVSKDYMDPHFTDFLVKDFDYSFEILKLDNVPSFEEQGTPYFDENWTQCVIPIITHKKNFNKSII
jgi:spermidine synthase